jgi:hypothetical protein
MSPGPVQLHPGGDCVQPVQRRLRVLCQRQHRGDGDADVRRREVQHRRRRGVLRLLRWLRVSAVREWLPDGGDVPRG